LGRLTEMTALIRSLLYYIVINLRLLVCKVKSLRSVPECTSSLEKLDSVIPNEGDDAVLLGRRRD